MTTTDHSLDGRAWLASSRARTVSDLALAGVALIASAVAVWDEIRAAAQWDGLYANFYPVIVAGLLAAIGTVLIIRGVFVDPLQPVRWSLKDVAAVTLFIVAFVYVRWWGSDALLMFGPTEFAALYVLLLVTAIVIARWSRLRAAGMTLLGLLLALVGMDIITGQLRLTMGLEQLVDGISLPVVLLGLVVVAEGLVCLASPALWLATFTWLEGSWQNREPPMALAIVMRIIAALAIAGACFLAFEFSASTVDIVLLLVFGVFGVASKLLGWNRLVLILALLYDNLLEQSVRQSMAISSGDPAVFLERPISRALLLAAAGLMALAITFSVRRFVLQRRAKPA